jgi:hypothetical protein
MAGNPAGASAAAAQLSSPLQLSNRLATGLATAGGCRRKPPPNKWPCCTEGRWVRRGLAVRATEVVDACNVAE